MEIVELVFDELNIDVEDEVLQQNRDNAHSRLRCVKTSEGEVARFILVDVVKLMGLKANVTTVGNRLDERDVFREDILTGGGTQTMITVNVMGLLQTVLGARGSKGKCLLQWIRETILGSPKLFAVQDDEGLGQQQKKKNAGTTMKKRKKLTSPATSGEEEDTLVQMAITFEKEYDQEAVARFTREYQEQHPERVLEARVYVVSCVQREKEDDNDAEDRERHYHVDDSEEPEQPLLSQKKRRKRTTLAEANKRRKPVTPTDEGESEKTRNEYPSNTRKRHELLETDADYYSYGAAVSPPSSDNHPFPEPELPPAPKEINYNHMSKLLTPGGKNTKGYYQQPLLTPSPHNSPFSSPPDVAVATIDGSDDEDEEQEARLEKIL